jgi:hypothetical protein
MEGLEMLSHSTRVRVPLSAAALALALALSACDDSRDGGAIAGDQPPSTPDAADRVADEREIAKLMRDLRQRYNDADGEGFCSLLSSGGQREVLEFADTAPRFPRRCAPFIARYAKVWGANGKGPQTPVRVRTTTVEGDTGTVTMNGGLAGIRSMATYEVARVNGSWKLVNPISGAETRRLPD